MARSIPLRQGYGGQVRRRRRRQTCWRVSICRTRPRRWCARCPVDRSSASPWPWRCCTIPTSTSSTSRPRASIRSRAARFTTSCARCEQDGKTVLISSHYLDEIEALADRVIILSAGAIVADGTPLELLARAAGASTLWLAVQGDVDAERLMPQATFEGLRRRALPLSHRRSRPRPSSGWPNRFALSGARLDDLRLKRPSLEDVYLAVDRLALRHVHGPKHSRADRAPSSPNCAARRRRCSG